MNNSVFDRKFSMIIAAAIIFILSPSLMAHKLNVFAAPSGDDIKGYCYMSGGLRVQNAKIQICDPSGNVLTETKSDEQGEFAFRPVSKDVEYTIVADAGDGHKSDCKAKFAEAAAAAEKASEDADDDEDSSPIASGADPDLIRKIVAEEIHKEIEPLQIQLQEYKEKIQFGDIIGGIGYILGVAGISFYFLSNRNKPS